VAHARERRIDKGEMLCRADAPATTLWFLLDGAVRIEVPDGRAHTVSSGLLGEEAAIGMELYLSDAVAEEDCRVLALPAGAVQKILEDDRERHAGSVAVFQQVLERWSRKPLASAPERRADSLTWLGLAGGWPLAILGPALVLFYGDRLGLDWAQLHFLVVCTAGGLLWLLGLVHPVVAVLVPLGVSLLLGIVPPPVMLGGFGSRVFFMVLSIYGIAIPLVSSGVITRGILLLLRALPATPLAREVGLFIGGLVLTPVVPNPERRVRILAPLAGDLHAAGEHGERSTRLYASALFGTTLFSSVFLSSAPMNFAIYGLLAEQVQVELPWLRWAAAASVVGLILLVGYPLLAAWVFRGEARPATVPSSAAQLELLGPVRLTEWIALVGAALFVVASATPAVHQVDPRLVALTIFSAYVMVRIVSHQEINLEIDWTFLLFLGAFLGISITASYIHIDRHLLDQVPELRSLMRAAPFGFVLLAAFLTAALGSFVALPAAFVGLIAMTFAAVNGVNPWVVGFGVLIAGECWMITRGSPAYGVVERLTRDDPSFDEPRILRLASGLAVLRLVALVASIPFWISREML
jgi:divalent anion:Na+ symporter, DASS family